MVGPVAAAGLPFAYPGAAGPTRGGSEGPPGARRAHREEPGVQVVREVSMTETPGTPPQPGGDAEGSHASVGNDVDRPGGGRTDDEVAVDDALGSGTTPEE